MKFDKLSRRMFLQGSGKLALMVPFMGSLLTKESKAQALNIPPRFIFISSQNGAQRHEQWYPSEIPMTAHSLYPANSSENLLAHQYHTGAINYSAANGISPIFDNKFNSFVPKMTFIKGLDQRFATFGNHEGAALLGNVGAAHASMGFCPRIPTIDQLMAYSKDFYPNDGVGYIKSIAINPLGSSRHTGYNFSNPYKRTGSIVYVPSVSNPYAIFRTLFENTAATSEFQSSTPLVDGVLDDYKRVRSMASLSNSEKIILDDYIDRLAQLELKLTTDVVPNIVECRNLTSPESIGSSTVVGKEIDQINLLVDMVVLAFQCNRTRVATFHFNRVNGKGEGSSHTVGDWHWASHNPTDPLGNQVLLDIYKWVADNALYPLVNKMNSITESNGLTMLDNSIVHFATSSANFAHSNTNLPTLLFGSAGGFLKTGLNVDYNNRDASKPYGILHNQYLTNIMTAMGLQKSQWNMSSMGFAKSGFPSNADGYGWYTNISGSGGSGLYKMSESKTAAPLPGLITASGLSKFV
jgi:hypothetical protein